MLRKRGLKMTKNKKITWQNATRKTWAINPVARIKQSKKAYTRKNKNWKKEI